MRLMTRDKLLADDRSWTQREWKAAYLALYDELQKQKAESIRLYDLGHSRTCSYHIVVAQLTAARAELAACKRQHQVKP